MISISPPIAYSSVTPVRVASQLLRLPDGDLNETYAFYTVICTGFCQHLVACKPNVPEDKRDHHMVYTHANYACVY